MLGLIEFLDSPRLSVKWSLGISITIFLALLPLQSVFIPNDHAGYVELQEASTDLAGVSEAFGKQWVSSIYLYIDRFIPYQVFTNFTFFCYLFLTTRYSASHKVIGFHALVILPLSPYFGYITKESLVLAFVLVAYFYGYYFRGNYKALFSGLMLLFGIFVRNYYIPLLFMSLGKVYLPARFQHYLLVFFVCILLYFGTEVFVTLYDAKADMWIRLRYYSIVNSIFPLTLSKGDIGVLDVFYLWAQNIFYLLTTIIRHPGVVGLASLFNLFAVVFIFANVRKGCIKEIWFFGLFVLLFVTYLVPDSGTFVRHSTLLIMIVILGRLMKKFEKNNRRRNVKPRKRVKRWR